MSALSIGPSGVTNVRVKTVTPTWLRPRTAALLHGCEFVGIDIDPSAVQTARARLGQTEKHAKVTPITKRMRVA